MVYPKRNPKDRKVILVGVGFDNKDGHIRMTKGNNFFLAGGSEETHEHMTETAVKFNEKLDSKGKRIEDLTREEFVDVIMEADGS